MVINLNRLFHAGNCCFSDLKKKNGIHFWREMNYVQIKVKNEFPFYL